MHGSPGNGALSMPTDSKYSIGLTVGPRGSIRCDRVAATPRLGVPTSVVEQYGGATICQ